MTKILTLIQRAKEAQDEIMAVVEPYAEAQLTLNYGREEYHLGCVNYIVEVNDDSLIVSCSVTQNSHQERVWGYENEDYQLRILSSTLEIEESDLDNYVQNFEKNQKIKKLEAEKLEIERKLSELM